MSYNIAQIQGLATQYGLPAISNQQAQDIMNNNGGGNEQQIDSYFQQQQTQNTAQNNYQSAINTAVGGLQTQQSNLAGQYGSLLQTVTGEYTPLVNQTTQTAGAAEAQRGIAPQSQLYQQQVQGALAPVYGSEAGQAEQIGAGSIADVNTLTQAIANMQAGGAGTASQLPLQYGSLSLSQQALPSEIAANQAQANQANANAASASYVDTNLPGVTFNAANNTAQLLGQQLNLSPSVIQAALSKIGASA